MVRKPVYILDTPVALVGGFQGDDFFTWHGQKSRLRGKHLKRGKSKKQNEMQVYNRKRLQWKRAD